MYVKISRTVLDFSIDQKVPKGFVIEMDKNTWEPKQNFLN